jgi:Tol biopolymer transport system component
MVSDIGSRDPLWSPDGTHLFYLQNKGNGSQIVSVDVQTQPSFMFLRTTPLPIDGIVSIGPRAYDVTPDGKHFVVMYPKTQNDTDKAVTAQINVTLNWFEELKRRVPTK